MYSIQTQMIFSSIEPSTSLNSVFCVCVCVCVCECGLENVTNGQREFAGSWLVMSQGDDPILPVDVNSLQGIQVAKGSPG